MRFLVYNHFFEHDIESLQIRGSKHYFHVVDLNLLAQAAHRHFPDKAFKSLGEVTKPEYKAAWTSYKSEARRIFRELYQSYGFHAVIAGSDTFFYLRPWVECSNEIGIPFIVVQKETTITDSTMEIHALEVKRFMPFISDLMCVCSERHKQFWIRAGAKPQLIHVTGQPRFDFYFESRLRKPLKSFDIKIPDGQPIVLYLSYGLGSYWPEGEHHTPWRQLRDETEAVLIELARAGRIGLIVKPHPQMQDEVESTRWSALAGDAWAKTIYLMPGVTDIRLCWVCLVLWVGFQTTALYEAMVARKKVIYTFWTEPARQVGDRIIPFHTLTEVLHVAKSPKELESLVCSKVEDSDSESHRKRALDFASEQLGPLDGGATDRCLRLIECYIETHRKQISESTHAERRKLDINTQALRRRLWRVLKRRQRVFRVLRYLGSSMYPIYFAFRRLIPHNGNSPLSRISYLRLLNELYRETEESVGYMNNLIHSGGKD